VKYEYAQVNIKNINSGAITELFNAELPKVLENIADDNTKPDASREIRLIIKIKPTGKYSSPLLNSFFGSEKVRESPSVHFLRQTALDGRMKRFMG